jgi:S-DNA-T family DNA segregation ATPase FtsK/SpoIIIE
VRYKNVETLREDIALAMRVSTLHIARCQQGISLEFPNPNPRPVKLLPLLADVQPLAVATTLLGLNDEGRPLLANLASPDVAHILVAGTTGCGKSTLLRTIAASMILSHAPRVVSLAIIDPKGRTFPVDFTCPHLTRPIITDEREAGETLRSLVRLMEIRDQRRESTPPVIVIVDELADLVMMCDAAEGALIRLAQRGREAGIHLVAATQRPSANVLSGLMRANFPLRLVGKVTSTTDAQVAAGRGATGAHLLTGRGDFLAINGHSWRFQAAYIDHQELIDTLKEESWYTGPSALKLPKPPPPPSDDPDWLRNGVAKLRAWWLENRGAWGAKAQAQRILYPDAPNAGSYFEKTRQIIETIEAEAASETTTTPIPALVSAKNVKTGGQDA